MIFLQITHTIKQYNNVFLQITHTEEMPESMMMKNAVISVFFLRFLQHGKYFKKHVPEKKKVGNVQFPPEELSMKKLFFLFDTTRV